MTDVRLISSRNRQLKPLVEAALANELRLLEAGIRQKEFISRYENDEINETMDFAEWIGESRMLEQLREKAETLRDIRFAN